MGTNEILTEFRIELELLRRSASKDFSSFVRYVGNAYYRPSWHHQYIADKINDFYEGKGKTRLMLFVPPQHGKSQLSSRFFPAYIFGRNPDAKAVISSYSSDLAKSFSEDAQKIIRSPEYKEVFSGVELFRQTGEEFTIENREGKCRAVGVTGGLTGHSVDIAIIDDPVKDDIEASSPTYRERVWQWYLKVLETRLHNDSKVLLIMTRWHEDDLAGRLLEHEPEKWEVIIIPAIKEDNENPDDPREIGEALWPEKHSLESLEDKRSKSETTFASLYQQRPAPAEGNKVKREWWEYCNLSDVPAGLVWDLWIDGAYTKQTENDPTGLMVAAFDKQSQRLYVRHAHDAHMEMPQLLKFVPEYAEVQGLERRSRCLIEPKASGKSLKQMINALPLGLSAVEIKSHLVREGKEARIQTASPKIEAGQVWLVRGRWNDRFVNQICTFPNATHDEYVDLIGYAADYYFPKRKKKGVSYL